MNELAAFLVPLTLLGALLLLLWAVPVRLWIEALSAGVRSLRYS